MAVLLAAGVPFAPAFAAGLAVAALIGFINGFMTIRFAIPSFITTLGMLFMARSLTVVISGGFPPLLPRQCAAEMAVHRLCRAGRAVPHVVLLVRR